MMRPIIRGVIVAVVLLLAGVIGVWAAGPAINQFEQTIHRYYDPQGGVVCYVLRSRSGYWQDISCLPEDQVKDIPPQERSKR